MNLLLIPAEKIDNSGVFTATPEQSAHIAGVLHGTVGDRIKVGVLNGPIGEAELIAPSKRDARLKILSLDKTSPPKKKLKFVIALPRPQSFKKCLHFLASAGIPDASFIQTARVEKSYWNSTAMQQDYITKEVISGLEQGVDTVPPRLSFYRSFRDWKEQEGKILTCRRFVAHPVNAMSCPRDLGKEDLVVAIGPEGGFIPAEIERFGELGFECVELGSHILRVEFALSYITGRLS